ncbi:unnamed protein product [Medioppia subpectinata]|uniref:Uncharacterized protein n=1 Tax=Medioppia subpectinata TaxID=1979941 RepID=A0A7R9L1I9_9ACAR|nr:unnamed protein product [Medioppia subpectinata]CAG2112645.1 unnamed protein product [Medioppia subpectinata]
MKMENTSTDSDGQRRGSAGIIRQKSFDDIEEDIIGYNQNELSERRRRNSMENKTISTDVLRRQYRELWQLRATYEAEESDPTEESSDTLPTNPQQKLVKNDSGYKSIERRDYSIDIKSDYMFRQFTTSGTTTATQYNTPPNRHSLALQHSIQEEQEADIQPTFV